MSESGQSDGEQSNAVPPARSDEDRRSPSAGFSRRRLLGTAGAVGGAGLALGAAGGVAGHAAARESPTALRTVGDTAVPFHGRHQAGITTPQQAYGQLVAFDLAPGAGRQEAASLLRRWSRVASELTQGRTIGEEDSGIAWDAGPSSLTVTFGFGRSFFERTGLTARRPTVLTPLPEFSADALDPQRSDGDLWIQLGSDDALVTVSALRALQREAAKGPGSQGTAQVRWQMSGFNRSPGVTAQPMTARNLMGQLDGINNPKPEDQDFDARIFVPDDGDPSWLAGGSYAVVRRIRMLLNSWETQSPSEQEQVIGRRRSDGAPLSGGGQETPVDLEKQGPDGASLIARDAHVRVAAPETNGGAAMLRRSFSYHDGLRPDGAPDAGLLFVCWQADPDRGFVPVQRKLDRGDALSPFLRHEASALFAVPGGAPSGEYVGQRLLEG